MPIPAMAATAVTPGQLLGSCQQLTAGSGTFVWGDQVHASVSGLAIMATTADAALPVMSVSTGQRHAVLPSVGDVTTCRVLKINPRVASVEILCVDGAALREPCMGQIRREDVRDFQIDKVEIYRSFR